MSLGIAQLRAEMARQHTDALRSLAEARARAGAMARGLRETGRLALIGMGGSHWVNRIVRASYRRAGLDATTHVASEYLRAPLPGAPGMLMTSQSGRSGEILRMIEAGLLGSRAFGLTMEAGRPLARALPSLVGAGGPELAYAATRSQLIALAQHAALLEALAQDISEITTLLETGPERPATAKAVDRLATAPVAVMVARGMTAQGVMDTAADRRLPEAGIPRRSTKVASAEVA